MISGNILEEIKLKLISKRGLVLLFAILLTLACRRHDDGTSPYPEDKGDYTILAKYDSIRSYPEGGGVFILSLKPDSGFAGKVSLQLIADGTLNAALTKTVIDSAHNITEITIRPKTNAEIKRYTINLVSYHNSKVKITPVCIDMYQWANGEMETPLAKRDEFKDWIISNYPKYSSIFKTPDYLYHTYPEILIVEHFSYLTEEYEVRFCYHVMIPPHNWSMLMIRKRNSLTAEFAAKLFSNGSIQEIPVADYPILLGY